MMLSHRFELNQQSRKTFEDICGEDVDLEQASYHADRFGQQSRIVVASVQTLNSYKRKTQRYRMEKFHPDDFGLVMIDEAHRAAAASYRRVVEHFSQNPNCRIIGVTATPDRLDKVGLGVVFDKVACNLDIVWGIQNGWLVPPKQVMVHVEGLDLSEVRTVGGDLDEKQLARLVEVEENLHAMAKPIVDVCGEDKQAIVFTASVQQAHRIAEMIDDYRARQFGPTDRTVAVSIDGSLSPQDPRRQQIVRDFKEGRIQYLCNCGVATEGFDAPNVRVVAIGRPTKSRALYVQMLGRGTRPLPGTVEDCGDADSRRAAIAASPKPQCTVIDFVGQSGRHKLICTTDVLAGETEPEEIKDRANRIASAAAFDGDALEAIQEAREQIEAERAAARAKVTVGVDYKIVEQRTLYDLRSVPDGRCPNYLKNKSPSEKQKSMMMRLGFTKAQIEQLNPRSASKAIDYAIRHPKTGFAKWLNQKKRAAGEL